MATTRSETRSREESMTRPAKFTVGGAEVATPDTSAPAPEPDDDLIPVSAYGSNSGQRGMLYVVVPRLVTVIAFLGLWQIASGPVLPDYAVSTPSAVASSLWDLLGSSAGWTDIKTTSVEVVVGFVLGVVLGTVMGLVLGAFNTLGRILEPLIAALNGIPKIALAPVFLLLFGIGEWSKITIAVTSVSFVMFYNLYLGMRLIRPELVEIIRVMGGRSRHVLLYVTAPSLASPFVAGLKAGGPLAVVAVVAGEFIASFNGIGHRLADASNNLEAADVFAALVILVVISLVLNSLLTLLDKWTLKRLGMGPRR
jgi:NitT/TauT family transport system permease protein